MYILASILMFVVGSIMAACEGDFSGIAAIGKFLCGAAVFVALLFLLTHPAIIIVGVIVLVLVVIIGCSLSS